MPSIQARLNDNGLFDLQYAQKVANPVTRGLHWFVDAENGNDSGQGNIINSPLKTIQEVVFRIVKRRNATNRYFDEYVYLMPTNGIDYDDDVVGNTPKGGLADTYVYLNTPGIHFIGAGQLGSVIINPDEAADEGVFNLGASAKRCSFENLVINTATSQASAIKLAAGADFPLFKNCIFNIVGASGPTGVGITCAGAVAYPTITGCKFYIGTNVISAMTIIGKTTYPFGGLIENTLIACTHNGAGTNPLAGIGLGAGVGIEIRDILIHGGDVGTAYNIINGIDVASECVHTTIARIRCLGCDSAIDDDGVDTLFTDVWVQDGVGGEFVDAEVLFLTAS